MNPLEPAAELTFLVGDPRRAFALAQELTVQPKMSHQSRGLWGYRGVTHEGLPLTVQSTGSGGPSAVPVIGDLASQGANLMVRLGTCLAIDPGLKAGTVILVDQAVPTDGASRLLQSADFVYPNQQLFDAFEGLGVKGTVSSHDLVERFEPRDDRRTDSGPAIARDLQTSTTLAFCRQLSIPAAALLIVAEDRDGRRLVEEELWELFRSSGKAVLSRLKKLEKPDSKPQVDP